VAEREGIFFNRNSAIFIRGYGRKVTLSREKPSRQLFFPDLMIKKKTTEENFKKIGH